MITVEDALNRIFELVTRVGEEEIALRDACGRVLVADVVATRDQPPFAVSVMDGYALCDDTAAPGATFRVVGEAAAGHRFDGTVGRGETVRIFTGGPVPDGANRVVIQEDVIRDGDLITLSTDADENPYIRPLGTDFKVGDRITSSRRLTPADLALAASMNAATVTVSRRPDVALIATGDELVMPGEAPNENQIIASNTFGLTALFEQEGASVRMLPIARDNVAALKSTFALAEGADLIVTIGGASVGDHDLVGQVASDLGMDRSFYKVAMRPGKPLMAGHLSKTPMIGLPGNPVSAMVCGQIFIVPALRAMQGLGKAPRPRETGILSSSLPVNGPREHYMRAKLGADGRVEAAERQDSSLLSVLAEANVLIVRAPNDPERANGEMVEFVRL